MFETLRTLNLPSNPVWKTPEDIASVKLRTPESVMYEGSCTTTMMVPLRKSTLICEDTIPKNSAILSFSMSRSTCNKLGRSPLSVMKMVLPVDGSGELVTVPGTLVEINASGLEVPVDASTH